MGKRTYRHSAYWYAYHCGWTYSEASTYTGKYLDMHTYRPRIRKRMGGIRTGGMWDRSNGIWNGYGGRRNGLWGRNEDWRNGISNENDDKWDGEDWFKWRNAGKRLDSTFNPLLLCACAMVDIGIAMRDQVRKFSDPKERDRMKRELVRNLRVLRRPFYYLREKERRRKLAAERRKIVRRMTTAPMPTPEAILSAWNERKTSREAMIRLGGLLDDLSCHVDSCLRFDENGTVIGRNGGIREWINENIPELSPKYKTLMRYKALATRLRQATGTKDPTPTSALLAEPRHEVVAAILSDNEPVFSHVFAALEHMISPDATFLDMPKATSPSPRRRGRAKRKR